MTKGTDEHHSYNAALEKITHENRLPLEIESSDSDQTQTYNDFLQKDKEMEAKIIRGKGEIVL